MLTTIATTLLSVALTLPAGTDIAQWGVTVDELKANLSINQAVPDENGYAYGDHGEVDADVYVYHPDKGGRVELYFFEKKLYKTYTIFGHTQDPETTYEQLVKEMTNNYGTPTRMFKEDKFGMKIIHNQWDDNKTLIDLRFGAGYVYEVRIDKFSAERKKQIIDHRQAI